MDSMDLKINSFRPKVTSLGSVLTSACEWNVITADATTEKLQAPNGDLVCWACATDRHRLDIGLRGLDGLSRGRMHGTRICRRSGKGSSSFVCSSSVLMSKNMSK